MEWFIPIKLDTSFMKEKYRDRPQDDRLSEDYWQEVIQTMQPELYEPLVALAKAGREEEIDGFVQAFQGLFDTLCASYGYDMNKNEIDGTSVDTLPKFAWEMRDDKLGDLDE